MTMIGANLSLSKMFVATLAATSGSMASGFQATSAQPGRKLAAFQNPMS